MSKVESQMKAEDYNIMIEQIKKESENMWITDLFVDSPCKPICGCYCWLLLCLMMSGPMGFMRPALGEDRDYAIWMDPVQIDNDILKLASADIQQASGEQIVVT
jgi:hypothetical protein